MCVSIPTTDTLKFITVFKYYPAYCLEMILFEKSVQRHSIYDDVIQIRLISIFISLDIYKGFPGPRPGETTFFFLFYLLKKDCWYLSWMSSV